MRESRTYGSVRGARNETRVPTATTCDIPPDRPSLPPVSSMNSAITHDVPLGLRTNRNRIVDTLCDQYTYRRLRLACGCVMFSYLTLHFLNHALGNISLQAMMWGTGIHEWIWHGPIGGPALYAAFLVHFSLALWALYQRRSFRMGWGEAVRNDRR